MTTSPTCSKCDDGFLLYQGERYEVACRETGLLMHHTCTCPLGQRQYEVWRSSESVRTVFDTLKKAKIERALRDSGVSPRFRSKRLSDLGDSPGLQKKCLDYVKSWMDQKKAGHGLYLSGKVGRGKTHTACAISNELIDRYLVHTMFVNLAEIANRVKKTFGTDDKSEDADLFEKLKTCELLVLDDLGVEKHTDWMEEQVYLIINHRYEHELPIIITSNMDLSEFKNERIKSRLYEMTDQIGFASMPDRRLQK